MKDKDFDEDIIDLLARAQRNELQFEEKEQLKKWLFENSGQKEWTDDCLKSYYFLKWSQEERVVDKERALHKITRVLRRKRKIMHAWYAIAVSIVLLCVFAIFYKNTPTPKPEVQVVQNFIPEESHAYLVLANGEKMVLDSTLQYVKSKDGLRAYSRDGFAVYSNKDSLKTVQNVVWHTIVVPRGGVSYVCLEDGSEIWLNSETEIRYPVPFEANQRKVFLSGEAYFKVSKDSDRAFIVHSGDYRLSVYGTEFNLNTYDVEKIEAVLVKGDVGFRANQSVREIRLMDSQLGVANSKSGDSEVFDVDVAAYIAWKDGDLVFMDEPLESIMKKIARWYDIQVLFEDDKAGKVHFNGNIRKYSDLKDLLDVMEKVSDVEFKISDKTICISKK